MNPVTETVFLLLLIIYIRKNHGFNMEKIRFSEIPDFKGKICPESHTVLALSAGSAIKCVQLCAGLQDEECKVASFETSTKTCHGCGTTDLAQMIDADALSFMRDEPTQYGYLVTGPDGIPDDRMSASSEWPSTYTNHGPERARLGLTRTAAGNGGWQSRVNNDQQFIQADFVRTRCIVGLVTQGRYNDGNIQYVKSYKTSFSLDCVDYTMIQNENSEDVVFPGNSDSDSLVTNILETPVIARCIRIHPVSFQISVCLRFDVLGF